MERFTGTAPWHFSMATGPFASLREAFGAGRNRLAEGDVKSDRGRRRGLWAGTGRQHAQPREGRDQGFGPGPGARQAQAGAPGRAHHPAGDVQEALAQPLGLGEGQLALEAEKTGPGEQLLGDQRELQPHLVVFEGGEGQVAHPGVLAAADLVLDFCPAAVAQLQGRDVGAVLVGDEGGVAIAL